MKIIIGLLIANCKNVEANKWINVHMAELTSFEGTQEFVNLIHKGHIYMYNNAGLPNCIGFDNSSANVNEVMSNRKKHIGDMVSFQTMFPMWGKWSHPARVRGRGNKSLHSREGL